VIEAKQAAGCGTLFTLTGKEYDPSSGGRRGSPGFGKYRFGFLPVSPASPHGNQSAVCEWYVFYRASVSLVKMYAICVSNTCHVIIQS